MVRVLNKQLWFTILYLPTRTLRIEGKEIVELTEQEIISDEFISRKEDFFILPTEENILQGLKSPEEIETSTSNNKDTPSESSLIKKVKK